ncbi:metal ABC transporter ATP-binding protein [Cellulomonas composti]|uniref:ABC transporter ATP-binding protein n=1 Tax=Cellulomonas composti TaxID=266130 RepID=A0A511J9R8_9CELL|nr:ATP-binding cassette domain-containing protein [Cellulomonas composti]GEL94722.1 ABC transporter ATP-binding protein [Cellulomonas composti]
MSADRTDATGPTNAVEAHGVEVTLGGSRILLGVDVVVPAGEVVALLGTNGSGKSTLVRALLGAVPLSAGTVHLLGEPLGPRAPWSRIGYVPQRMPASSGVSATAVEVVASGLLHGRALRPPRGWRTRVRAALDAVGMAGHERRPVQEMSGGQQQRVLIARALVREPELLVLDEPTSGIDVPTQATFVDTVARLHGQGATVVVILHELGPFEPLIQRAVVLRHGRVVHDGLPPRPRLDHAGATHHHEHAHHDPDPPPTGPALGPTLGPTLGMEAP